MWEIIDKYYTIFCYIVLFLWLGLFIYRKIKAKIDKNKKEKLEKGVK